MSKIIGIDYGKTKIGLARSEGEVAQAWKVVAVRNLNQAVNEVLNAVAGEQAETIIIGIPESGESYTYAQKFLRALKSKLSAVSVIGVPETLSTQKANETMRLIGVSKGKRRNREDAFAAAILLQDYLDCGETYVFANKRIS